jgi:hypothetical protein
MKKFMLFTLSALVLAALAFTTFTPGSLAAGKVIAAAKAAFAGNALSADDTSQASPSKIESEKHNGLDDAQPTLAATPDDNGMDATDTPDVDDDVDVNESGEMEFSGTILSINSDSWVIGSQTVQVNAQTELNGTFVVGELVKVHTFLDANGILTAREIQKAVVSSDDNSGSGSSVDDSSGPSSNSGSNSLEDSSGKHGGADDGSGHH